MVLATLLWGATFVVIRDSLRAIPPLELVFGRFALAGAVLAAVAAPRWRRLTRGALAGGALAGLCFAGGFLAQAVGLTSTSAGSSAFLTCAGTLFAAFYAWPLLGQRPSAVLLQVATYGGLAPDLFNFRFDAPTFRDYMQTRTHNDFMPVWKAAKSKPAKALAFGFVSHNDVWGVDSTAHRAGITFGQQEGYVIAKANILGAGLDQALKSEGLYLPPPVILTVAHELVERGVDLLMKTLDPMIGVKMAAAALPPNPNFPLLITTVRLKIE